MFPFTEDTLAADADEWEGDTPLDVTDPAELDGDGGVAVVVAANAPLEAKVVEGRMLDDELAGLGAVLGCGGPGETAEQQGDGENPEESQSHREPARGDAAQARLSLAMRLYTSKPHRAGPPIGALR
ncbi:MAG: hypothetical protein ABIX28_14860 [Vicinamibacterales bacterium]